MRNLFINELTNIAKNDERIFVITPDLGFSVLEPFQKAFPDRFINVGIAEQNAMGMAAGLALSGKIVYVYSIIPFVTSRCYEQIQVDCAYMNTNVRIVGVGAGFAYGAAGATHHAINDIAIMRALPNMSVVAPGCLNEAEYMVYHSIQHKGPLYIRLAKKGEPRYSFPVEFGKLAIVSQGSDFAIIATSSMLESAYNIAEQYIKEGKKPLLLSAHTLKPFDDITVKQLIDLNIPIITVEEHSVIGGLASIVSEIIACSGKGVRFLPVAAPDMFSHYIGDHNFIKDKMGILNYKSIIDTFIGGAK